MASCEQAEGVAKSLQRIIESPLFVVAFSENDEMWQAILLGVELVKSCSLF